MARDRATFGSRQKCAYKCNVVYELRPARSMCREVFRVKAGAPHAFVVLKLILQYEENTLVRLDSGSLSRCRRYGLFDPVFETFHSLLHPHTHASTHHVG